MNSRPPCLARVGLLVVACFLSSHTLIGQRLDVTDTSAEAVVVESATISTEVTGRLAVTTFDLVFRNPNHRVLEGTFSFPLLDGQSVVRFALDINGALREAVPVEKTKGRVVFEEIERRRVDPGLLEQTAGNNYRARVFPIPASGTRRIVIAYQEDVARAGDQATYRLNLDFPDRIKDFRLAVTAYNGGKTPPTARTTLNLALPAWRNAQSIEVQRRDFVARGLLELELPRVNAPRVMTGRWGDEEYFYAEAPLSVPTRARKVPKAIGLLWDSSASGSERDHAREFQLLEAWFQAVQNVEVRLTRLRDQAEAAVVFHVRNGRWHELRTALEKTIYDGATSLDGLIDDRNVDEWLLFSDGLINYGSTSRIAAPKLQGPVHTVLASRRADSVWLRSVAERHHGEFINLIEVSPPVAANRLRSESPRVLRIDREPSETAELFPEIGATVLDGQLIVTGILRGDRANVRFQVGTSDVDARMVDVTVDTGKNSTPLAARAWAAAKIAHLATNAGANRADIQRTSRDFGIITPDTSLIVLELVSDYVRYEITPPDELRREWKSQRNAIAQNRTKAADQHLEAVVRAFNQRVAWWEKTYPKDTPSTPKEKEKGFSGTISPSMPPLPSVGAPASRAAKADDIVVLQAFEVSASAEMGYAASTSLSAQYAPRTNTVPRAAATTPEATTITLQRWSPNTGYLDRLRRTSPLQRYAIYLEERRQHQRQPGFYLDVANFFFEGGDSMLALRILSNLAELELEDVALLRVLAHRLTQAERPDLALPLFERVLALRADEPQSRRDLALVCADLKQYQRAVYLLWEVVSQPWSERFPEIEVIALGELNAIAASCGENLNLSRVDRRLRKNLPVQTRVILTWDTNDCDMDLWVTDPNDERAYYSRALTYQGGRVSRDFTAGYGPEEFLLRAPKPGTYRVNIDYFGDARQTALGPVTAQVRLITGFGTSGQQEKRITVRLDDKKQNLEIGAFEVPASNTAESSATRLRNKAANYFAR